MTEPVSPAPGLLAGVLGGLGPDATVEFLRRLLQASGARTDQEHVRTLVYMDGTVPDRNRALRGEGPSPGPHLARMAAALERGGADFLVLCCNAAHRYAAEIRAAVAIPMVDLVSETAAEAHRLAPAGAPVGLLAADACLGAGLYQGALLRLGHEPIELDPEVQAAFMTLLYLVKSGDRGEPVRREMAGLAAGLVERGARLLVAGCTEVALVLDAAGVPVPLVDSTDVLVRTTLAVARRERPP